MELCRSLSSGHHSFLLCHRHRKKGGSNRISGFFSTLRLVEALFRPLFRAKKKLNKCATKIAKANCKKLYCSSRRSKSSSSTGIINFCPQFFFFLTTAKLMTAICPSLTQEKNRRKLLTPTPTTPVSITARRPTPSACAFSPKKEIFAVEMRH